MINYSNVFSSPSGSLCGQVTGGISGLGAVQEAVLRDRESSVLPGETRDGIHAAGAVFIYSITEAV